MYVNKQAGFSLLEVMVVLVIIGMIMSIVAPNIMGQQEEAAHLAFGLTLVCIKNQNRWIR